MKFFDGCTALITGASAGIGREIARQLAPHAGTLVLVARRLERLEELKAELARDGLSIFCYALDLADDARVENFIAWINDNAITPDVLVNNAGLGDHGPFETSDWQKTKRILDVNITALTRLTHALLPALRSSPRRAAIINVSSIAAFFPVPEMAVYAATKAYVSSFSEALRAELRGSGVSVTALCPGPTGTEFGSVAERDGIRIGSPDFFKVPVEQVAHEALAAAARARARVIPGLLVAVLTLAGCAVPLFVLRLFLRSPRDLCDLPHPNFSTIPQR